MARRPVASQQALLTFSKLAQLLGMGISSRGAPLSETVAAGNICVLLVFTSKCLGMTNREGVESGILVKLEDLIPGS